MNLLILGGTVFLGRHLVSAARAAGHTVTTFNRGTNKLPEQASADLEKVTGDRNQNADLARLAGAGKTWDAVIDTCGYTPPAVAASATALKDCAGKYVFISSISVYQDFRQTGMDETAPLRKKPIDGEDDYGSLKAACETAVSRVYGDNAICVRAGLIVGPFDSTDRFTYWPGRVAAGGKVLAPGNPDRQVQFIDVRDLSDWILRVVASEGSGAYNATGPNFPLSMDHFLDECKAATESDAEFVWLSDEELTAAGVEDWTQLPLWLPESNEDFRGFMSIDCTKAHVAELTYRPLADTIRDTLTWDRTRDAALQRKAGLPPQRETELLTAHAAAASAQIS